MTALFKRVSLVRRGYDREEVDDFFEHARLVYEGASPDRWVVGDVQTATFDLVRRGYRTGEVDAALDRLEAAFVAQRRVQVVTQSGQHTWNAGLTALAQTLYERLARPARERFAHPHGRAHGYDSQQVDALCERLIAYFDRAEPLTAEEVRTATFTARRGAKAYDEPSVDAFLRRATEVLLGVG